MTATLESALLLADLESSGLTVKVDAAGRLLVTPTAKLTSGQREGIAKWRDDLLALIGEREALDVAMLSRPPPLARIGWLIGDDAEERAAAGRIKAGILRRMVDGTADRVQPVTRSPAGSARPAAGGDA